MTKLRLVTLNNFFANIDEPQVRDFFVNMLHARATGYGPDYKPNIMPFDTTDFVGWHHLFCVEENRSLVPIGGFKQILLETSDYYHLGFPMYSIAKAVGANDHLAALEAIFEEHRQLRAPLLYGGSWTIQKSYRADKEFARYVREVTTALFCHDFIASHARTAIGLGTPRFKADAFFATIGYQRMKLDGVELPAIGIPHADNEQVVFIRMDSPTEWARECLRKHRGVLDSRLYLGGSGLPEVQEAA